MRVIREYKKAESLEEAWQLNQKKSNRGLGGMVRILNRPEVAVVILRRN